MISDESGIGTIEVIIGGKIVYYGEPGMSFDARSSAFVFSPPGERKLKPGTYALTIEAWDKSGNRSAASFSDLQVVVEAVKLSGLRCYPVPFQPGSGEKVSISYELSNNISLSILIYDNIGGALIWQQEISAGEMGGKKGANFLSWDGSNALGKIAPNDVYHLRIVSGNKVVGSAELMVAD